MRRCRRAETEHGRETRRARWRLFTRGAAVALACGWIAATIMFTACEREPSEPAKSPDTLEVEREAGDFLDYYAEVLRLAQLHSAAPDSFRLALGQLPGSHVDGRRWEAWTRPYRHDPRRLTERLERIIAERKTKP